MHTYNEPTDNLIVLCPLIQLLLTGWPQSLASLLVVHQLRRSHLLVPPSTLMISSKWNWEPGRGASHQLTFHLLHLPLLPRQSQTGYQRTGLRKVQILLWNYVTDSVHLMNYLFLLILWLHKVSLSVVLVYMYTFISLSPSSWSSLWLHQG